MILHRALQGVFRLLYNQFAWSYDWVAAAVSAGQWVRWVRGMAPRLAGEDNILEVGHGPGHLLLALHQAGAQPVGVDLSAAMGRRARNLLRRAGAEVRLVRADAANLPFPDAYFDAVVLTFPADYIAEASTWQSFKRMVGPGGRILVLLGALPSGRHPLHLLSRLLFRATGQLRVEEIKRVRGRFLEFFDEIGLQGELFTETVSGSQLFFVTARHAVPDGDPAV